MISSKTVTIAVAAAAVAAWLAAAGTSNVRTPPPIVRKPRVETSGAELAAEVSKLHERLRPTVQPHEQGRNLFQFNSAARAVSPRVSAPAIALPAPAPAAPPPPLLKLSGIAEDTGPDGPIRTAVISGQGQLFLVKEGEMVTPRYRVARISADVVELVDRETNATLRLALR